MSEVKKISPSFSEEEFGKRMDRCVTDLVMKGGKFQIFFQIISNYIIIIHELWVFFFSNGCDCKGVVFIFAYKFI